MVTKKLCKYCKEKLLSPDEQRSEVHNKCYFNPEILSNFDTLEIYGEDYPQRVRSIKSNIMYLSKFDFNAKIIAKMNKLEKVIFNSTEIKIPLISVFKQVTKLEIQGISKHIEDDYQNLHLEQFINVEEFKIENDSVYGKMFLKTIPNELGEFKKVRKIKFDAFGLQIIPDLFQKLTNLEHIHIDGGAFSELPPSMFKLPNLKSLWIISTKYFTIPSLKQLPRLEYIDIGYKPYNQEIPIEYIPKNIPEHIHYFRLINYEIYWDIKNIVYVNITKDNNKARIGVYKQLARVLIIDQKYRTKLKKTSSRLSNMLVCYFEKVPEWITEMKNLQILILVDVDEIPDTILEIKTLKTVLYKDIHNYVVISEKVREFIEQKKIEWYEAEEISKKYDVPILSDKRIAKFAEYNPPE